MAENSKIEWTTHTFNPWIGCTKVSPGCDHCYAEAMMDHRYGRVQWGGDRLRTSPANWKKPLRWNADATNAIIKPTVFCASLADVFDNDVPPGWRRDLFELIDTTPNLLWLLLTKRIGNVLKLTDDAALLPYNAALGATMVNQEEYDRDSLKLMTAGRLRGAAFTFASVEPMLGPISLDKSAPDWIICGGESGTGAREMDPAWARSLRDQCADLGRAFFMKQMSKKAPIPVDLFIRKFPGERAA
jgi:protein gp37